MHLIGYVDDIEAHLAALDLAVVPSICRDACPRTAIESMAVGIPVVASDTGGLPEIVRSEVTGLLVPPDSPMALADALVALAADGRRRAAMSSAARVDARDRFDSRRTAAAVAGILHEVGRAPRRAVKRPGTTPAPLPAEGADLPGSQGTDYAAPAERGVASPVARRAVAGPASVSASGASDASR